MKTKLLVFLISISLLTCEDLFSQGNVFPSSGNVGIGTTAPTSKFQAIFSTSSGSRTFILDGVRGASLFRAGDELGWAMSYGFLSNNKSNDWGGFGGFGSGNSTFNYWFIGRSHTTAAMVILLNGNVGIGSTNPTNKLEVNGVIKTKEVNVTTTGWADYVFTQGYHLRPIIEVESFIKANGHLPNVPSEKEVLENGVNLLEMNTKLLEKIEELTLYVIQLNSKNLELERKVMELENKLK